MVIPVIIGATGIIHKNFGEINNKLGVNLDIREAQKIVILGTVNICRTFFQTNLYISISYPKIILNFYFFFKF